MRELRNAVERAISWPRRAGPSRFATCRRRGRGAPHDPRPFEGTLRERIARVESEAIREALEHCQGNRRRMAEALGLSRPGLRYKMRRLGLGEPDEK